MNVGDHYIAAEKALYNSYNRGHIGLSHAEPGRHPYDGDWQINLWGNDDLSYDYDYSNDVLRTIKGSHLVSFAEKQKLQLPLWKDLWYSGEISCLFADSNVGKSIYAVQMAVEIAKLHRVVYFDFELTTRQFMERYGSASDNAYHHFHDSFLRAEIDPCKELSISFQRHVLHSILESLKNHNSKIAIIDNLSFICPEAAKPRHAYRFMMELLNLKRRYNLSILLIAHTPKRDKNKAISQDDLAGSKILFNFFDSCFAIGKSCRARNLRYIKQLKSRAGEILYDADNVIEAKIMRQGYWIYFKETGFGKEISHLMKSKEIQQESIENKIKDMYAKGHKVKDICKETGISRSTVWRICHR